MDHMTLNIVLRARIPGAVKMGTVMQSKGKIIKNALKCAFPYTIPIFAGFWFLGLTYGVYMNVSGFSFWYPMLMSLTIFWRELGICCSQYASRSLCAGTGLSYDPDDSGATSVLRDFHARQIQGNGLEKTILDFWHV